MELNYNRLGERIKNIRRGKKLSIEDLAQKVQYSAKSIVMLESGQASIGLELFANLCTVLDVTPNDLLEGEYRVTGGAPASVRASEISQMKELIDSLKTAMKDEEKPVAVNDDDVAIQKIKEMICQYKEQNASRASYRRR